MKTLIILAFLITSPCLAQARGGISGSGGGNSISHRLVEEYVLDVEKTEGYEIAEEKIKELESELPVFGKALRAHLERVTFYSVPKKLKELPKETTGLDFTSEQLAIHRDDEVFIDEELFAKMGPKGKGMFFIHEAVLAMLEDKKSVAVRKVVAQIFAPRGGIKRLQTLLAENGLGASLTRQQTEALRSHMQAFHEQSNLKAVRKARELCAKSKNPPTEDDHTAVTDAVTRPVAHKGPSIDSNAIFNTLYDTGSYRAVWSPWSKGCYMNACSDPLEGRRSSFCYAHPEMFPRLICEGLFFRHSCQGKEKTGCDRPFAAEQRRLQEREMDSRDSPHMLSLLKKISGSEAYRNIAAIAHVWPETRFGFKPRPLYNPEALDNHDEYSRATERVQKQVDAKLDSIRALPLAERHALLCRSLDTAEKELLRALEKNSRSVPAEGQSPEPGSAEADPSARDAQ